MNCAPDVSQMLQRGTQDILLSLVCHTMCMLQMENLPRLCMGDQAGVESCFSESQNHRIV